VPQSPGCFACRIRQELLAVTRNASQKQKKEGRQMGQPNSPAYHRLLRSGIAPRHHPYPVTISHRPGGRRLPASPPSQPTPLPVQRPLTILSRSGGLRTSNPGNPEP
jgi:hypothetical protein